MIAKDAKRILSAVLSLVLVTASPQLLYGYQDSAPAPANDSGNPAEPVPLSADQLQALVAPIAPYPDGLVAQVLAASTFPDQVAVAEYWLQQNKNVTGDSRMQAIDQRERDWGSKKQIKSRKEKEIMPKE